VEAVVKDESPTYPNPGAKGGAHQQKTTGPKSIHSLVNFAILYIRLSLTAEINISMDENLSRTNTKTSMVVGIERHMQAINMNSEVLNTKTR
jgi:hypothetical protein